MSRATFVWTALPNGWNPQTGRYRLSVQVAPRLEASTSASTLAEFPVLSDWPASRPQLSVELGGAIATPVTTVVIVTAPTASTTYWQALFPTTTPVTSRSPAQYAAHDGVPIRSFFADRIHNFTRNVYRDVATAPGTDEDAPTVDELSAKLNPILVSGRPEFDQRRTGVLKGIDATISKHRVVTRSSAPSIATHAATNSTVDFILMDAYWNRDPSGQLADRTDPIAVPEIDFHALLTFLGPHPHLLRLLGLVIDLEIELAKPSPSGEGTVRIIPTGGGQGSGQIAHVSPPTACILDANRFETKAAAGSDLAGGHLRLGDAGRFYLTQVDVDAAGRQLRALTTALPDKSSTASEALPALASGGLAVHQIDIAAKLKNQTTRVRTLFNSFFDSTLTTPNPTPTEALRLDDVVRGYRVDVWDDGAGAWFPLTRRDGVYRFLTAGLTEPVSNDEAAVSITPTMEAPRPAGTGPRNPTLYIHERLFRWLGWSLSVPRPGKPIYEDDSLEPPAPGGATVPELAERLEIDLSVARDLPRLRFGRRYALRARATDVAGNGPAFDDGASVGDGTARTTAVVPYLRYEPVSSPTLIPRAPRTAGESVDVLVIRSETGADTSPSRSERHVVAPATSQELAELHGRFDIVAGETSTVDGSAARYAAIASRSGQPLALAKDGGGTQINVAGGVHDDREPDGVIYVPHDSVAVPYLPDVLARGAAVQLKRVDRINPAVHLARLPFGDDGSWPDYESGRVALIKAPEGAEVYWSTIGSSLLEVALAPGQIRELRISSHMNADDLALLGTWQWMTDGASAEKVNHLTDLAVTGRSPTLSPFETVRLVHAVRQPLQSPEVTSLTVDREPGETAGAVGGQISHSRSSTGQLDLMAEWDDPIDEGPGGPDPTQRHSRQAFVFSEVLDRVGYGIVDPDEDTQSHFIDPVFDNRRHDLGDTKYHAVRYSAVATSAFLEYFRQSQLHVLSALSPTTATLDTDGHRIVPGTVLVRRLPGGPALTEGENYKVVEATDGTTSVQFGPFGRAFQTPVDISFVRQPATTTSQTPLTVDVHSTARPAPPKVAYAVPIFKWEDQRVLNTVTSIRRGRAVRVYLERPWWSSGEGELLGVVTVTGIITQPSSLPFLTRWGFDPVVRSAGSWAQPTSGGFANAVATGEATLAENGGTVGVAGHQVHFDAERDLWYADIAFNTQVPYGTFVHLALARYQPKSVPGRHISPVVSAGFIQLNADRTVNVVQHAPFRGTGALDVTVVGRTYTGMADEAQVEGLYFDPTAALAVKYGKSGRHGPQVSAWLEQRVTTIDDPDLGWEPTGDPVTLTPAGTTSGGAQTWIGSMSKPLGSVPLRLIIEEHEVHYGDKDEVVDGQYKQFELDPKQNNKPVTRDVQIASNRRLVHRDIIDL